MDLDRDLAAVLDQDLEQGTIVHNNCAVSTTEPEHSHRILTLYCQNCGYVYKAQLNCGDRTCPDCRAKWYGYHFKVLKGFVQNWQKPVRFLTLTLKNYEDNDFNKGKVKYLRRCFNRLLHRSYFKGKIRGGFYFIQLTNLGNGWHLHLHCIYEGDYIPKSAIRSAWQDLTGSSYIVDIKQVYDIKKAINYLIGDLLQKPRLLPQYKSKYNEVLKGARLVQGFGCYARAKIRQAFVCPVCGSTAGWYCPEFDIDLLHREKWLNSS